MSALGFYRVKESPGLQESRIGLTFQLNLKDQSCPLKKATCVSLGVLESLQPGLHHGNLFANMFGGSGVNDSETTHLTNPSSEFEASEDCGSTTEGKKGCWVPGREEGGAGGGKVVDLMPEFKLYIPRKSPKQNLYKDLSSSC